MRRVLLVLAIAAGLVVVDRSLAQPRATRLTVAGLRAALAALPPEADALEVVLPGGILGNTYPPDGTGSGMWTYAGLVFQSCAVAIPSRAYSLRHCDDAATPVVAIVPAE